jgi:hypothetical protein
VRVLVCGGRDYRDYKRVWRILDEMHKNHPITAIIEGGAAGADRYAAHWAIQHDVAHETFGANWERDGRAAGVLRNQRMLDVAEPELVVAFPGGRGTADMVRRAHAAQVLVREVK